MITEKIILGDYKYLCEYYEAKKDSFMNTYKQFVMLRNYNTDKDVIIDTDILFIEKDIFDEMIQSMYDNHSLNSDICSFPISNTVQSYSKNPIEFNTMFDNLSLYDIDKDGTIQYGNDVYELYDKDNNDAYILCDKIKIYHPAIHDNKNMIVHLYNTINGINFHYVCREYASYQKHSENEIIKYNQTYSEYIEVYLPNVKYLFNEISANEYNVYYKEDLNIICSTANKNFISEKITINNGIQYFPLGLLIQPFRIVKEHDDTLNEDIFVKQYLKLHKTIENNYLTFPISMSLFPYSIYNESIRLYELSEYYNSASIVFFDEYKISLASKLGFSNGILSTLTEFNYPFKEDYLTKHNGNTNEALLEAYHYFYDSHKEDYDKMKQMYDAIRNNDSTEYDITKFDLEEYEELNGIPMDFLGFQILISNELSMKNVLYKNIVSIDIDQLDDFSFNLNNIFNSWDELYDNLIISIQFIDNFIGISIPSNFIVITKEWFKYMINDEQYVLTSLYEKNNQFVENMKEVDLKNSVNFINNIQCIVNTKTDNQHTTSKAITNTGKILFKPIFYRVNDLQNVRIRKGLKQNIGINLVEYMTKVDTFKLIIEGKEYIEIGRNDVYVMFSILGNELTNYTGSYDIVNQDDEYISTGNYSIY